MKNDPPPQQHTCRNCGNMFTGYYCNLCGEKVLLPSDRSFKAFLNSMFLALTLADSRFVKGLWLIVSRPGFLSKEFAEGRKVKYIKPISIFFLLNLVYFLFPVIQLFSASLRTQINSFQGKIAARAAATKMTQLGFTDIGSFSILYDQKTTGLAKMLVIVFVILASLPLNLIYRSRNRYFTDHLGISMELVCFNLLINALLLTLIVNAFRLGSYLDETVLTAVFVSTNLYFLIRSGRIFYDERGVALILKSIVMIGVLKVALEVYRAILFYVTLGAL
jgi:hypothetical protein